MHDHINSANLMKGIGLRHARKHDHDAVLNAHDMLLKLGDPIVGRQLIVLVVAKDVNPHAHSRLILELGF